MNKKEIFEAIEKNLTLISIGDEFSTQAKLFRQLVPEYDWSKRDGNKTIQKYVSCYVKWERIDSASRKIKVTEIIEHPEHVDGRINNGGAHNVKFLPLIAPALLSYSYSKPLTYNQIYNLIYGFPSELIFDPDKLYLDIISKIRQDDITDIGITKHKSHLQKYMEVLRSKLREITKSALNSLQHSEALIYQEVYMIQTSSVFLKDFPYEEVHDKISVAKFLSYTYQVPDVYSCILENLLERCPDLPPFNSLCKMNLFDLISKLCEHSMIPNEPPFSLPDDCIEDFIVFENRPLISCDTKNEILNLSESKVLFSFIQNIQNIFTKRLNHTKSTIYANPSAMKTLFNHMNIFFKLMGWKYVYKAIDISVSDTNVDLRFSTDYSLPHLLDALESYMFKHINKLTMPYYLVAKDKLRECKKRDIEFEARLSLNAEIPYLAEDPAVNLLHCKIFHLPDNKRYFLTENSQEQE